jgi:hypothetical protein
MRLLASVRHSFPARLTIAPYFVFALAMGCSSTSPGGTPASGAVTKTIGPEGGSIVVEGATVTFPADALTSPTSITITATDDAPPAGFTALSRVYRCEPSGTTFAKTVTMAMTFTGDATGATMFWSSGADPTFKDVGGTIAGNVMSAQVAHFSSGFVALKK